MMRKNVKIKEVKSKRLKLLPYISEFDANFLSLKVYFFGTNQFTIMSISKEYTINQLILHVIALSDVDPQVYQYFIQGFSARILGNYKNPELYEMRLLKDENQSKEYYVPMYEEKSILKELSIGTFNTNAVAFCRNKKYNDILNKSNKSNYFIY